MAKKASRPKSNSLLGRVYLLNLFFLVAGQLVVGRLFLLQVKDYATWSARASEQYQALDSVSPPRGEILWRGKDGVLQVASTNKNFPLLYAIPKEVSNPEEASAVLANLIGVPIEPIFKKLSKAGDPYEVLAHRISAKVVDGVRSLALKGVYIGEERGRVYPGGKLASHVVGFVGASGDSDEVSGRYGIESKYDATLKGKSSLFSGIRDARGEIIFSFWKKNPVGGANVVLTIDPQIQFEAERLLEEAQQKWRAKSGNVIVLEPSTGRILAMANVPSFDPNEFNKEKNLNAFFNHSVSSRYEPGSVFKVFTMAAGLESGAVTSETTYYDSGEVKIGPHIIRNAGNSAPRKNITMTRVLERSYNIGAVFVAMKTGKDFLRDFFLQKFRFEAKTGIDLPSELGSDFKNLESPEGRDINFATASFGQGIAVTPIKLVESFAAFANGGQLMKPYVVEEIQWPSGKIEKIVPKVIGQSVREDTVRALIPMMEAVVHGEYGSGKLAKVSGYRIAGKTGTGEIPFAEGRGYSERVNHTFVGFGPTSDPRAIILVRLEEPIGARYAEATAVPIFRELMKFILRYYEVLPDDVNGGGR